MSSELAIPHGAAKSFLIAGAVVTYRSALEGHLVLPASYAPFEIPVESAELSVEVETRSKLSPSNGALIFDSRLHWRVFQENRAFRFELFHPPTAQIYCQMTVAAEFDRASIAFSDTAWRALEGKVRHSPRRLLPYPIDQLLFVPRLALRDGFLLHAAGAVSERGAMVFAGHSGDGKTTLARLLKAAGYELLGDERIALRWENGGFMAYGTPWPGEGDVVSPARYPLGALFLLQKTPRHAIRELAPASALPELLARAIVPYYLENAASRILSNFSRIATSASLGELGFAQAPGLRALLSDTPRADELDKLAAGP